MAGLHSELPLEVLYFELIIDLIEVVHIDSASEATSLGLDLEPGQTGTRLLTSETSAERLVDHFLEALTTVPSPVLELLREIVVQRQCRSHADIMMPLLGRVKMCGG